MHQSVEQQSSKHICGLCSIDLSIINDIMSCNLFSDRFQLRSDYVSDDELFLIDNIIE